MDRLENMDTFIRVVETGSISAAAGRLGVAKSAVSRRLKELEEHLGVELFHRTTRRMNLTDTGRTFYHQACRILDDVIEAELSASQAHTTLQGGLKVALPLTFGVMHLGPAIRKFLDAHPQIDFDLDFNDREVNLMDEGFDLAIRIANLPDSSLIARRLAPIQTVMCASPDYLEQKGTPTRPEELQHHQCLSYNLLRDPDHWQMHDASDKPVKVRIKPYLKAGNGEFLRDAAIAGLGIVLMPTFISYQAIEQGKLVPIMRNCHFPLIEAWAIYPHTRHLSQRVRVFVEFLATRFSGTPYWDQCLA